MCKTEISYRAFIYQKTDTDLFSLLSILQLLTTLKVKDINKISLQYYYHYYYEYFVTSNTEGKIRTF